MREEPFKAMHEPPAATPHSNSRPHLRRSTDRRPTQTSSYWRGASASDEADVLHLNLHKRENRPGSFLRNLANRRLAQWFVAYLAFSWVVLQLLEVLAGIWNPPMAILRAISLALALGTVPALILAWYHGEAGRQKTCCTEIAFIVLTTLSIATTVWWVCF